MDRKNDILFVYFKKGEHFVVLELFQIVLGLKIFHLRESLLRLYPIVAVPARNEEERLPSLIRALGDQTWLAVRGRHLRVVIVLNNCDDASEKAARTEATYHPNLLLDLVKVDFPAEQAHVGSARRLAMERAWQISSDPMRSVLLTTDADSAPIPTWIDANLRAIEAGADIVGGRIAGNEAEEASLRSWFSPTRKPRGALCGPYRSSRHSN